VEFFSRICKNGQTNPSVLPSISLSLGLDRSKFAAMVDPTPVGLRTMIELILYTRRDCELCAEMEVVLDAELPRFDARLERVEIDAQPDLETLYGQEVPVLFVNGRKAFKFRCTARELRKRMLREVRR
jgi:glutaredoxin